ncbi:MAG TPA: hypothetical protein VFC78_17030 [Tepidisphaeraceae bacterium]|nr:hypothetical protein [Tepidisphaeraceae bacterium]
MPTTQQVNPIVEKVERLLSEAESTGIHLKVLSHSLDDDWLYVVVAPTQPGGNASDYARLMSQVEGKLRASGDQHVLLVPELED